MKVLVVEDDATLREALEYNLTHQGYTVSTAADGEQAVELARQQRPDIVLLDVMLPGVDGFEVCRRLRKEMDIPILMLTARSEIVDRVVGLEIGADDYITKPFSMRELMARVKAHLRRQVLKKESAISEGEVLACGDLVIHESRREVLLMGHPLRLNHKEYELLLFLVRNRGIALSREVILERVWGWDYAGDSRTVDVHVRWLRSKIEPDPANPTRILTIRGIGYRFEG